jgi:hypothetical protein
MDVSIAREEDPAANRRILETLTARLPFVMRLHPDDPYEPYRRTRLFYERMGFELALSSGQGLAASSSNPLAYYLKPL